MRRSPAVVATTTAHLMVLIIVLAGCSAPPWQTQPSAEPTSAGASAQTPAVSTSPAGSPVATPTGGSVSASGSPSAVATPPGATNDLASGSVRRTVTAGAITLTISYWSTLDMGQWTPLAAKPLTMSLSAKLAGGSTQDVYLTKVTVTPTVTASDQAVAAPAPLVDTSSVEPGYQIDKPNSYQQVFVLPAVDATATSLGLTITYEMLLPTTPTSKTFSRQTASDILTIALA